MITDVLDGDLFSSDAQTLVNTVNCVGVMGRGIALEFRKRFPDMYEDYRKRCAAGKVRLGRPYLFPSLIPPWVLNFPTKDDWRSVSRLSDIISGLQFLEQHHQEWGITSLAVPPLGCGQGQLEWRVVGPTLYQYLNRLDIPVKLYAPHGTDQQEMGRAFLERSRDALLGSQTSNASRVNPSWVALAEIVGRITNEPYHWPVGRTTFQKLAYFATEAGIPTGLAYNRGSYGPFAPYVKTLLTKLVNNGILHEERLGRMFSVRPGPTYQDAANAYRHALRDWEEAIGKITDLFLRMQTNRAEVAATVLFAARSLERTQGGTPSETDVFDEVKRWKQRRRPPLEDEEIARSIRDLNVLGWLNVRPSEDLPVRDEALADA